MLKQPALFRFETTEPEPNLFIGDGQTLWFYNEMLEQLTIYDAAAEVNRTPFVLLTSTKAELWAQYNVSRDDQDLFSYNSHMKALKAKHFLDSVPREGLTFGHQDAEKDSDEKVFDEAHGLENEGVEQVGHDEASGEESDDRDERWNLEV